MEIKTLEELPFLKGLRTDFSSVAEMLSTRAQEISDKIFVKYYDRTYTYSQTNQKANKVAHYLQKQGVKKGDVVSLLIINSPEIYDCMFGAQKLGAISGSINFALQAPEIAYVLDDSKPKIVFISSDFKEQFSAGYEIAAHKPIVVEVETEAGSSKASFVQTTIKAILSESPDDEILVPQDLDDPYLLLYSSGTTGKPKGILLSNRSQLSVCRDVTRLGSIRGDDIVQIILPMFHTNPICVWTFPTLFSGQTVCIRKVYSPNDFWPSLIENGTTILQGVPAMYNYVYYSIDPSAADHSMLKLKWAFSGAAPLSVDLIDGFKERFDVEIIEGYGLTEGTGISTANPLDGKRKPGSIGIAVPEQEVAIMDDNLNPLKPYEKGEICIKGDATMIGYLNKPDATAETICDGWLRTGDIGYRDDDGFFYIVDRKKDMINRGGENIYPREIENVLEAHPDITAVAVLGHPDEALGERVRAVIEVSKPGVLTDSNIKTYLKDKIAKYKIPEIIEFTEQIPRNPTGKILKKDLRK